MRRLSESLKCVFERTGKHSKLLDALRVAQSMYVKKAIEYFRNDDTKKGYVHIRELLSDLSSAMRDEGQADIAADLESAKKKMLRLV